MNEEPSPPRQRRFLWDRFACLLATLFLLTHGSELSTITSNILHTLALATSQAPGDSAGRLATLCAVFIFLLGLIKIVTRSSHD